VSGVETKVVGYVNGEHQPQWSPDGSEIVFMSAREGSPQIYRVNADGADLARLTDTPRQIENVHPCWSPDGTKILWTATWNGGQALYMMNRDGSGTTRTNIHSSDEGQPHWGVSTTLLLTDGGVAARP
jgi:TolB protein